ncbi:MAG TPA: glycoside hydrolase family 2 TIM barrel-domain containing protein, partial [Arachidicoccus sp.]|nr:glycoside hydrolase family 2 TIM barrel-domain containing protein [Arachidicoccus sp.]
DYKYKFKADKQWSGKTINIVFEGVMTDADVKINGKSAGKVHQGAFYQFKYDISSLLKPGTDNLLEVKVSKRSENQSINIAERGGDFWVFGGIFRPVYLEILPESHIERMALDAEADGNFDMQVFIKNINKNYKLKADFTKAGSAQILKSITVPVSAMDSMTNVHHRFNRIALWSPEFPNLYRVRLSLKNEQGEVIHTVNQKFGFRTAELRPHDGFYLNGKKVKFKGVDHHSFWPESGRTTSKALSISDVLLIKDMNMNAIRMSHYPPDSYLLDVCDSLGLMVLDELTGWQHYYDDSTGHRLVKEMVLRDVNHPSIVIWDNGNEGGFNRNLDKDFGIYDPQKRLVIHPWERFNGTNTKHYPDYNYLVNADLYGTDVFFPTESLHGLYDGGHGAGLDDYWNLMMNAPRSAGAFLWVFADEGVVRKDKNDSIDTHGNRAPDGIVGPHREKEGSYYTIKEIWSPIYIAQRQITSQFDGQLTVENRYMFTNLNQCSFSWKLISFDHAKTVTNGAGKASVESVAPGKNGLINLSLPASWKSSDALYLTAMDPDHKEIFTWSWPIKSPSKIAQKDIRKNNSVSKVEVKEANDIVTVVNGSVKLFFSKTSGYLEKVIRNDSTLSLSGGPALAGFDQKLEHFEYAKQDAGYIIQADYKGQDNWLKVKWVIEPGMPAQLSYAYHQRSEADYMGITFNYPENNIKGMRWLGRGPYHVWKNRLKGLKFGIWEKPYNNTTTGESWSYPEFKGNHENVYWVTVQSREMPFTVYTESSNLFFQMLKTPNPKGAGNNNTTVNYPDGNIGFMNAIQAIGTKFKKAESMGPQSQKNVLLNGPNSGVLWFDFR